MVMKMSKLQKTLCALVAVTTIGLSSCERPLTEGSVYRKVYEPSSSGFIPVFMDSSEHFIARIKSYDKKTGKIRTESYRILRREDFEKIKVGDYFRHEKGKDFSVIDWKRKYDLLVE